MKFKRAYVYSVKLTRNKLFNKKPNVLRTVIVRCCTTHNPRTAYYVKVRIQLDQKVDIFYGKNVVKNGKKLIIT